MPRLDSLCFGVYLRELSKTYPETLNVVVLDNAPAHIAGDLLVPENVVLLFLPLYSPELNPVERLWQDRAERRPRRGGTLKSGGPQRARSRDHPPLQ